MKTNTIEDFKIGDKVRLINVDFYPPSEECGLVVGNTGTVTGIFDNGILDVRTDNAEFPTDFEGIGWAFSPEEIEKIDEALSDD